MFNNNSCQILKIKNGDFNRVDEINKLPIYYIDIFFRQK